MANPPYSVTTSAFYGKSYLGTSVTVAMGAATSPYGTPVSKVFASSGTYVLPDGYWMIPVSLNGKITIQVTLDATAGSPTWVNIAAEGIGTAGILSDGASVRISASAADTVTLIPLTTPRT